MDAFFASVEQLDRPELRGKPVIVGAPPDQRGVVAAASYEARKFGVHSAMPSREAFRRCPHGVFVPPNGKRYEEESQKVLKILEGFTPLVEPLSIDEAFLDVTHAQCLFGTGRDIAVKIREAIRRETGLTASVGVATNKFLAKLASDMNKPDGLTVVPPDPAGIVAFLAPLPVGRIPGVGKVSGAQLQKAGFRTIGDLQKATAHDLAAAVGQREAEYLLALARGEDDREVDIEWEEKSLSREHTFPQDVSSREQLERVLCDLAEDVGRQLRQAGKYAALAHLKLRWQGFETITRQKPLPHPCCNDFTLREMALKLFRAEKLVKPVRLIGFGVSRFAASPQGQLDLFASEPAALERREKLSRTVDKLRSRFGEKAIRRASDEG